MEGIVVDNAADIILLQQDLGVLERGVTEGRRAFGNIMKFIMMAMSSNFGNMFSMAGATLILPFLPMLPMQILLNNLLCGARWTADGGEVLDQSAFGIPTTPGWQDIAVPSTPP